ncbi:MAG: 50S ribosomal protein L11 methyltransferase [Simkania sp.]|nr:50S ribosomal protein L11 methyltransferase [Simkania sp.]
MIDWHHQWATHALNFYNGFAHVPLASGKQVRLKPGPGFGDLSHPTTRLVLRMMTGLVQGKTVIDLGCGSGILSLCAAALGAKIVHGIDHCEGSLLHAKENAHLNGFCQVHFGQRATITNSEHSLLLINMISSEQEQAWREHPYLHGFDGLVISSGLLTEQKAAYLIQVEKRGWTPIHFQEEEGWLAGLYRSQKTL